MHVTSSIRTSGNPPACDRLTVCFTARLVGGELVRSDESTDLRWIAPSALDDLPIHHTTKLRLQHFLEHRRTPYVAEGSSGLVLRGARSADCQQLLLLAPRGTESET